MEKDVKIEISTFTRHKYKFISSINKFTLIKLVLVFIILVGITANTLLGIGLPKTNIIDCIYDRGFEWTNTINQLMINNVLFRNSITGFGSIIIDIVFLVSLIHWALNEKTWRYPITMGLFYGSRGLIQRLYLMNFPEGYIWECRYVPSLVVNYFRTNDFFFSGHVGLPLIAGMEMYRSDMKLFSAFCFMTSLYEGFLVIVTRAHYTIDIVAGYVFSHYSFIVVDYWFKSIMACIANKRCIELKEEANETEAGDQVNVDVHVNGNCNSNGNRDDDIKHKHKHNDEHNSKEAIIHIHIPIAETNQFNCLTNA